MQLLAALDILAVANLVNYFGRVDSLDAAVVSPILIMKNKTKVGRLAHSDDEQDEGRGRYPVNQS